MKHLLFAALLMMSPALLANQSIRPALRIPHDTRPFQAFLNPGDQMLMAGSIQAVNYLKSPIDVYVRFFLQGGWFLEIRQAEGPILFSAFVERGVWICVTEAGITTGRSFLEKKY